MCIDIMLSCSGDYLPYAMTTIASVINSKHSDTKCRFYLFCYALSQEQCRKLCDEFAKIHGGSQLYLYNTNKTLLLRGLSVRLHSGQETAANLLAAELLPFLDRVIALDCDVIVRRDLTELYQTPMENLLLAGVRDYDFVGQYYSRSRKYMQFYNGEHRILDPLEYLQGGVLLINLREFRNTLPPCALFDAFVQDSFLYDEQDFWNLHCIGKKLLLDPRWNVLHDNDRFRKRYVIELAPDSIVLEYSLARQDPWIIHYAGEDKPWKNSKCDFANEFWAVVQNSGFYIRVPEEANRTIAIIVTDCLRKVKNEIMRFYKRVFICHRNTIVFKQEI